MQGVPPGTQPHHYVNYYISLHQNPDAVKMKEVKPFRERQTPYPDTISDMKRPLDHPRDMPTHVVHNLEVRICHAIWTGVTQMFPLHFQTQLMTYYDESIAYMCDSKEDYRKMQNHFEGIDVNFGCPDTLDVPSQVHMDWSRWAHERTVNAGCLPEDSHKWLLERDLDWKAL
eukprot:5765668-Amphidinium_carterae.1